MKEAIGLELDMLNILYVLSYTSTSGFTKGTPFQCSHRANSYYAKQQAKVVVSFIGCQA